MNKTINTLKDHTDKFKNSEIKDGKILAMISYIGPVSLITFLTSNNRYTKYHAKQAVRLFLIYIVPLILFSILNNITDILWRITDILISIIIIFAIVLSLNGIINVINHKAKELPIVNKLFKMIR